MFWDVRIPKELYAGVFVFLTTRDLMVLDRVCTKMVGMSRIWIGDDKSQRLRPLPEYRDPFHFPPPNAPPFSKLLADVYLPDLVIWSRACQETEQQHNQQSHMDRKRSVIEHWEGVWPRRVLDSLFTETNGDTKFNNKHVTAQPVHESAWQNTLKQVHNRFFLFFDAIYGMGRATNDNKPINEERLRLCGMMWDTGIRGFN